MLFRSAGSFVPGPIGMLSSAAGFGKHLREGDISGAVLDFGNILSGGTAKWLKVAKNTANLAGKGKVANRLNDKLKLFEF